MNLKLKDPTKVYYCKEQKKSLTGDKTIPDVKVTHHVRQLLNEGVLVEVREEEVSEETKAKIVAEAKEAEAKEAEEARFNALSKPEQTAEIKAKKEAAAKAAKELEKA